MNPSSTFKRAVGSIRQNELRIPVYQLSAVFILVCLLLSGLWLELDRLTVVERLGLLAFLTFLAFSKSRTGHSYVFGSGSFRFHGLPNVRHSIYGLFWGMVVIAPVVIYLWLTWDQEFPYLGDNQYHESALIESAHFWKENITFPLLFLGSGLIALFTVQLRIWIPAIFIAMLIAAEFGEAVDAVIRYPGIGRLPGLLLVGVTGPARWDTFLNVLRTSNVLALVTWLFILRPLFIKRWPGIRVVPFALVFFYQPEVVGYFTSAYLEPWALILVLLAVELVYVGKSPKAHYVSYLLVGLAALVKEQMIFVLPFVWMASHPLRQGERTTRILCSIAAATPFVVYYLVRKSAGVSREFSIASPEHIFSMERLSVLADRLMFHLGLPGICLVLLLFLAYIWLLFKARDSRTVILSVFLASVFQFLFFYVDGNSLNYAGYPRFLLAAYLLLGFSALIAPDFLTEKWHSWKTVTGLCVIFILQATMLVPYNLLALEPGPARNFSRHYDSPIYLPIRDLIKQAENAGALKQGQEIYVADPTGWDISSISLDYTGPGKKYRFSTGGTLRCHCSEENKAILVPFIYFTNLNRDLPEDLNDLPLYARAPMSFYQRWREVNSQRPRCIKDIVASCANTFKTIVDGEVVGIMGVDK